MVFPENCGDFLSIDEVSLSQGEAYTFITHKQGRGKEGSLVASVKGTKSADIIAVLQKIPYHLRENVQEITLDMAKNMELATKSCFPNAHLVTDRFHVVKLLIDSLQHLRIKLRWNELDIENEAIAEAKKNKTGYKPKELSNGDTLKQLLARSRYSLAKKECKWTSHQRTRMSLLFEYFPSLQKMYYHIMEFRAIYEQQNKCEAKSKMECWIDKSFDMEEKVINTSAQTIQYNLDNILNFFNHRNTNANAESFNSKIKLFRANLRGVTDTAFFLFRLKNLFA